MYLYPLKRISKMQRYKKMSQNIIHYIVLLTKSINFAFIKQKNKYYNEYYP